MFSLAQPQRGSGSDIAGKYKNGDVEVVVCLLFYTTSYAENRTDGYVHSIMQSINV